MLTRHNALRAILAASVLVVICAATGRIDDAAAASGCTPRAGKTMLANSEVQVYLRGSNLYGCRNGRKRHTRLARGVSARCKQLLGCGPVGPVHVGGRFVVYGLNATTRQGSAGELFVADLSSRRRVRKWRDGDTTGAGPTAAVFDAVVTQAGQIAWITVTTNVPEGRRTEVHVDTGDGDRVVDRAVTNIDPRSLALSSGGVAFWTHAGEPRAFALR
jgi:hypothetical protein